MPQPMPVVEGAEVTHRDVVAGGLRMHVAEAGAGPPLMLVHGWPQHWWIWRRLMPDLARDHRVIAPDLRGFGWSDAPPGAYAKEELAGDLLALLDALGLERLVLAGHDWGGFAGFLLCLRAPERIERFVALSIVHPWFQVSRPTPAAIARTSYQFVLATPMLGELVLRRVPAVVRAILEKGSGPEATWTRAELDSYADPLRERAHARATSALYRTFLTKELRPIAKGRYAGRRLTVPTRLLVGEHDPVITPERLAGFEAHADDMLVESIAGAGHFLPEEAPDAVIAAIRRPAG
jgi:pimeloyl-ACP methyl ester carboxylesterase